MTRPTGKPAPAFEQPLDRLYTDIAIRIQLSATSQFRQPNATVGLNSRTARVENAADAPTMAGPHLNGGWNVEAAKHRQL